jgi:GAF domain
MLTAPAMDQFKDRLQQKERELSTMTAISRIIGQVLPLRLMLDQIAAKVAALLDCPYCAILLQSPQTGQLAIEGAYGLALQYIELINAQSKLSIHDLVGLPSSEAYHSGQPMVWEDVRDSPAFDLIRHAVKLQGYVSMVAVPLNGPDGPVGTLTCYHTTTYHFTEDELLVLTTIASHAAVAIHNRHLLAQLEANVTSLTALNQILARQHTTLTQSEAIHRRFTTLVLEEHGLPSIIETLAGLLKRPVYLFDQRLSLITQATAGSAPVSATNQSEAAAEGFVLTTQLLACAQQLQALNKPASLIHLPTTETLPSPILLAPLVARGAILGYLVVSDLPTLTEELEQRAIEHAATVCALELVKQRVSLEVERRIRSNG